MASYTTNYNLKKPAGTDFINVQDLNENADLIDTAIKNAKDAAGSGIAKVTGATAGNMAQFTATGQIEDSGIKFSIYNGGFRVAYDDGL